MIKDLGPYEFADYIRFGLPLQVLHLVLITGLCAGFYGTVLSENHDDVAHTPGAAGGSGHEVGGAYYTV